MLGEDDEPLTTATLPAKRRHVVVSSMPPRHGRGATGAVGRRSSLRSLYRRPPAAGVTGTARMGHGRHRALLGRRQGHPGYRGFPGDREMIATGFVEAGASVYISSRKAEACQEVAELSAGGRCMASPPTCRPRPAAGGWPRSWPAARTGSTCWSTTPVPPGAHRGGVRRGGRGTGAGPECEGRFHLTSFALPLLRGAGTARSRPG